MTGLADEGMAGVFLDESSTIEPGRIPSSRRHPCGCFVKTERWDRGRERSHRHKPFLAWHFTDGDRLRGGEPLPEPGVVLRHDDETSMCHAGLHASVRLMDAMTYAPGDTLHRVIVNLASHARTADKVVAHERVILWSVPKARRVVADAVLNHLPVTGLLSWMRPMAEEVAKGRRPMGNLSAWLAPAIWERRFVEQVYAARRGGMEDLPG